MALIGEYAPSPTQFVRNQVEQYESTGGREGGLMQGRPCIILTTLGARSGKLRKTPLMRVEHDGAYAVIASQGGAPTNPAWYANLLAHPRCELQDGPDRREYLAHEATGTERDSWWARAVDAFPPYQKYQERTDRRIPVLVLTRVDAG